jgi:hypothetical protein
MRSLPSLPRLPLAIAAAVTGLVVGIAATLLVWGGQRGCDAVRGRPSCGGYGLLMLVGIVVVCFLLGVALLKAFRVDDPGVTAFFGVTLPLLAILGLLLDYVFDSWMAWALPLLVAVCFVLAAYLVRALEAANPSPYADETVAEPGADADRDADEHADTRVDGLPRYAPSDES